MCLHHYHFSQRSKNKQKNKTNSQLKLRSTIQKSVSQVEFYNMIEPQVVAQNCGL